MIQVMNMKAGGMPETFRIQIESVINKGTTITVIIPKKVEGKQ